VEAFSVVYLGWALLLHQARLEGRPLRSRVLSVIHAGVAGMWFIAGEMSRRAIRSISDTTA
jgi:hypothetical protein